MVQWFPSSRFSLFCRRRVVYVVLYLKVDPANARKHKEEPSRTPTTTTTTTTAATAIDVRITTTVTTTYIPIRPVNGRRHRARAMVVAASAVGLGRVQLPRQRTAKKTEKKTKTTEERGGKKKGERAKERKGERRNGARSNTETTPDFEPRMDLTTTSLSFSPSSSPFLFFPSSSLFHSLRFCCSHHPFRPSLFPLPVHTHSRLRNSPSVCFSR